MAFPLGSPSSLDYDAPEHPKLVYRSVSGASRTRLLGSVPVGARLRMSYVTTTENAALVTADYFATYSGVTPATIPAAVWLGHEEIEDLPDGTAWYYTAAPAVTPLREALVRLTVEFDSRLEV